jgi:3-hydroxyisobutyrate dehydrogenase-like beta-hydroxyacid dehydrogenase
MTQTRPIGVLGTGRMGTAIAGRLLDAGEELLVYDRTPAQTAPLAARGAGVAAKIGDLAACPVVFISVTASADVIEVVAGPAGLLTADPVATEVIVDCSTVSSAASAQVRVAAAQAGVGFVASPISGNPAVVGAGQACFVASGPSWAFDRVRPHLLQIAKIAVHVGEAEQSRLVKLCHNLYLGVMVQALVEVTTLAEKSGSSRAAFLEFLGATVAGSPWVCQRTPSLVAGDWTPTFTLAGLRKDFDIGVAAAREHEVPMLAAGLVHQLIQSAIGQGLADRDMLALYDLQAAAAGLPAASASSVPAGSVWPADSEAGR